MKVLRGDRERNLNRAAPIPANTEGIDLKAPPRGIGAKAAKVWRQLAPDLVDKHVLTEWDVPLFTALCRVVAHVETLETKVRNPPFGYCPVDGYTCVGSQKQLVKSPYWSALNDAYNQLAKLGSRFGLSPGDRANLVAEVVPGRLAQGRPILGPERLLT
ncbi:hypothetical protein BST16_06630 [Mycobacterium asiaticum DSM 44297]|nr:hypothetical protein BST16_06630 [Mycobacterium asiaticum DSM 44297]